MTEAPILRLCDVHKSFGGTEVLRGITLTAARGDATRRAFDIGPLQVIRMDARFC